MNYPGHGIVAWNAGSKVKASVYDGAAGTWGPDETIARLSGIGDIEDVSVAMYGPGLAVVVWGQGDQIWSLSYDRLDGGWSADVERIDDLLDPPSDPRVASFVFDSTNSSALAVWRQVVSEDPFTQHAAAFGSRRVSGAWDAHTRLDTNPAQTGDRARNIFGPRVAQGGFGIGVAVWEVAVDPTGETVSFASRQSGGLWGDAMPLGPLPGALTGVEGNGMPDVGVDANGHALAVYVESEHVWGRRLDRLGDAWGTPVRLSAGSGVVVNPRIAVNGDGKAIAVWTMRFDGRVHVSRYTPGSGWSPSQIIDIDFEGNATASSDAPSTSLRVGIDAEGRGRALWSASDVVWTVANDGTGWGFAEQVAPGRLCDLAVAPIGRAIGVWWDNDGLQRRVWLEPPPSSLSGEIVFASYRFSGDFELWTMPPDGSRTTRHTIDAAADTDPVWSPDGTKVCFVSDRDAPAFAPDATDLHVWNRTTGLVSRLTWFSVDGGLARDPAWSPDGSEVAYSGGFGQSGAIGIVDVATGEVRPVSPGTDDRRPSWRPDGARIVYGSEGDLLMVDPSLGQSQTPTVISDRANFDEAPAWRPDGNTIAYAASGPTADGIQLLALTTGTITSLTTTVGDRNPAWSPDGSHIAFVRDGAEGPRIWIVNGNGQDAHEISDQVAGNEDPDWRE